MHLPLLIYMVYRVTGSAAHGLGPLLRPFARGALYFQMFTLVDLLLWGITAGFWRLRRWWTQTLDASPQDPGRRRFLRASTAGGVGVLVVAGVGGSVQAYGDPEITRLELPFWDLPQGLDGIRIVHLSDLHAGPLVGSSLLKRWRVLAEREKPDILVITGDFVDSLPEEMGPFVEAFQSFSAPLGRFAILGNHDYFTDPHPIWNDLEQLGFACLENHHAIVNRNGAQLAVLGLQDPMARNGRFLDMKFGPGPMPQDVLLRLPKEPWRLCLCHRPSNWNLALETGARLTLSGHTHGGQINIVPGVSSAYLVGPYTQGIYREKGQVMYVNRGLGVVGVPMRISAPPEIAVITLRRKEIPSMLPGSDLIE